MHTLKKKGRKNAYKQCQARWRTPLIPALGRQKPGDRSLWVQGQPGLCRETMPKKKKNTTKQGKIYAFTIWSSATRTSSNTLLCRGHSSISNEGILGLDSRLSQAHPDHCIQWVWSHTPVIPALRRWRQGEQKFKASLSCLSEFKVSLRRVRETLSERIKWKKLKWRHLVCLCASNYKIGFRAYIWSG